MIPQDPVLLLSFINMRLRDFYESLDALCEDLNVEKSEIEASLETIDYHYSVAHNQFK